MKITAGNYYGILLKEELLRCFGDQCLVFSNRINNVQHTAHDHVIPVFWKEYSFDHIHCFIMTFLTSSDGGLVFINSDENPDCEAYPHIRRCRTHTDLYSPIHMMAPRDNPRPNRYVFRVGFENVVRPVTMAIPECAHGVS